MTTTTQQVICTRPDKCPYRNFAEINITNHCPNCPENALAQAEKEYDILAGLAKARAAV